MKRVLVTGMSGTGKSSLLGELAARGYRAKDEVQQFGHARLIAFFVALVAA